MAPLPLPQFFRVSFPAEYIAHVEINRPEKLNAFCDPMWPEMRLVFESLSLNPNVRVVLFSGAGDKGFTTGLDVQAAAASGTLRGGAADSSRKASALRLKILDWQSCVSAIHLCQKPVIALLHGYVYGAGIDISTACDIRWCAADAKFCIKEADIGLAADLGTLARLPKVLGGATSFAKEVALSARVFGAEEALRERFVSRVWGSKEELVMEGLQMATVIAGKSPVAVQGTKHLLDQAWGRTVEDNLNYTAAWNMGMLQSTDVERAMTSGLRKTVPVFEKL